VDEARTVIRRLERIEALQNEEAPAAVLLTEVRQLLREGEAWLAAERHGSGRRAAGSENGRGEEPREATEGAASALAGCRESLRGREEVTAQTAESASL
jgi:hypothetical protein